MDASSLKEIIELCTALAIPAIGLVAVVVGWKTTGHLDTKAALSHAAKLGHIVIEHVKSDDENQTEDTGVAAAVAKVEQTLGRKSLLVVGARKLSKNVRAQVEDLLRNEHRKAASE